MSPTLSSAYKVTLLLDETTLAVIDWVGWYKLKLLVGFEPDK